MIPKEAKRKRCEAFRLTPRADSTVHPGGPHVVVSPFEIHVGSEE
jgi:hypothetical protein